MSDSAPRLFTCQRNGGDLRITKAFCGQSWQRAQTYSDPEDKVRLAACLGCATGERNAQGGAEIGKSVPRGKRFTVAPRAPVSVPKSVERKRNSGVAK